MKELEGYRKKIHALPPGAEAAEAEAEKEDSLSVSVSGGAFCGASASCVTELFVRVTAGGTGMAYTQDLEEDPLDVMGRAMQNSAFSEASAPEPMNGPGQQGLQEKEPKHSGVPEMKQRALEIERFLAGRAGRPSLSKVTLYETIRTTGLVNSRGRDMSSSRMRCGAQALLVRERGGHRHVFEEQLTARGLCGITETYFLEQLGKWEAAQLPETGVAAGEYRAVLDASVACNILATAWQMFSGPLYLSGGTALAGRLGEKAFSSAVTLRDLPDLGESGFSFPFDCEGSACFAVPLVTRGKLTGLLHTLSSAREMDVPPTGNAGRKTLLSGSVHTRTAAMPRNFLLAPGGAARESLLRELGDGLYVFESFDVFHSINIASGRFAIPCRAVAVRGGRPCGTAGGLTMNGSVPELLACVERAADDVKVLPMVILNSYAVAAPSLLVRRLRVGG